MIRTEQQWRRRRRRHTQQRFFCLPYVIEIDIRFGAFSTAHKKKNSRKNLITLNNDVIAGKWEERKNESEPRMETVFFSFLSLCADGFFVFAVCLPMWNWNKIQLHCEAFASTFLSFLLFHESNAAQCDANHSICIEYSCCFVVVRLHPVSLLSVSFVWRYCTSVRQLREAGVYVLFSWVPFYHTSVESASRIIRWRKKQKKWRKIPQNQHQSTDDYLCATLYVLASIYVDYVRKANEFACFDPSVIHFSPATSGSITQPNRKNAQHAYA